MHGIHIEWRTHIDVTKACTEDYIARRARILEAQVCAFVEDDVTAITGIHRQIANGTTIDQPDPIRDII